MDRARNFWHFSDMRASAPTLQTTPIPIWSLYGESRDFPDVLHIETIRARAAELDWQIAPHRHAHLHQVFLITTGAVQMSIDGAPRQLTPPFLLTLPAGVVHGFRFAKGTQGWVLTVPVQTLPEMLSASAPVSGLAQAGVLPVTAEMTALFQRIAAEHASTQTARATMLRALALQVACLALRGLDAAQPAAARPQDARFAQFQDLLRQHLRAAWGVEAYARALSVSPRHLSRICHAATGQTAAALIEQATLREACRLLVYTRASVASIGYGLGYDDPSYFSRAFRRVIGRAPNRYRADFDKA
ncbi:helix-turn-helix domain-containing protein [Cypionkella sp.]|uniref:helix-turn-helix domain-containing protein n=1 Tax=Cypionkella sp. TaxID=2811411 RepID=UPI002FDDBE34